MRHQKLRALYLPPSIAEQLLQEPGGLEFFKGLDFLCYTGAPFSPSAGEQLAAVTELCPLYGSTEAFQVPQLAPAHADDWAWMEWNPNFQLEMQLDNSGAYELVLFANSSTEKMSALNHNMPGVSEYRTKDLFKQHPTKPGLWQYYGRRDDIIVLSNGEKFNPVPMELKIQSHPSLSGALIVGQGRPRATLLVEPKSDVTELKKRELPDEIWPLVEETNRLLPAQGRILRGNLLLATPERPFVRAGKGTVVRKLTEQLYKEDLDVLYADDIPSSTARMLKLEGILKSPFETSAVKKFIRDILQALFPELAEIGDDEDLFSAGLDSVMIGQMLDHMKKGVQDSVPRNDLTWLDTRTVYRNSSIRRLAQVLSQFLNSGQRPDETVKNNRTAAMTALVQKYTAEFSSGSLMSMPAGNKTSRRVVLVGSTGYLGPQILRELLANADIESIYCLNRGRDAADRTANAMELSGQEPEILKRVKFISTDLNSVDLGLSATDIQLLSSTSDTIIYNAWKPDFSLPLSSFEKPFLPGLRAIIDIARASANVPRIVFISSIAAVGNWSHVFPVQPRIPEARVTDPNVALHMGYGESKWIAEQILQIAHDTCGIPVSIVRFGQVGGSSPPVKYAWPAQGWLLAIIRASKAMGAFPTHVAPVDWIPIDILAKQIVGVVEDKPKDRGYQVFNLVHSEVAPWDVFLNTLIKHFNIAGVKISLPEWLNKLEEAAQTNPDAKEYVALKFADFLRSMGDGREDMTCVSDNISKLAPIQMPPLTEELLVGWLQDWEF
jgi:thioester reductase-like protein